MAYVTAALIAVSVATLLNLVLIVRLHRRHTSHYDENRHTPSGPANIPTSAIARDSPVPRFIATSVSGDTVHSEDVATGRSLLAFLSTDCSACRMAIPELRAYAKTMTGTDDRVVCVVSGQADLAREITRELDGTCESIVEGVNGDLTRSFGVLLFPTFVLARHGIVVDSALGSSGLHGLAFDDVAR